MSKKPAASELLAGLFAEPPTGRGRPALDSLPFGDARHRKGGPRVARLVFEAELRMGTRHGALTAAVREVAQRLGMPIDTVKRYATRYRSARRMTRLRAELTATIEEADRRMLGMPDDVRCTLESALTTGGLLRLLRENEIDGTCPQWLVDTVRRGDFLSPK
ncbi:MAG: hypothetical protein KF863_10620 [Rubrivivax sp.]|nr:hypothetical protein [Rubrivivax sp.]